MAAGAVVAEFRRERCPEWFRGLVQLGNILWNPFIVSRHFKWFSLSWWFLNIILSVSSSIPLYRLHSQFVHSFILGVIIMPAYPYPLYLVA
jgi:hypothetical protein